MEKSWLRCTSRWPGPNSLPSSAPRCHVGPTRHVDQGRPSVKHPAMRVKCTIDGTPIAYMTKTVPSYLTKPSGVWRTAISQELLCAHTGARAHVCTLPLAPCRLSKISHRCTKLAKANLPSCNAIEHQDREQLPHKPE